MKQEISIKGIKLSYIPTGDSEINVFVNNEWFMRADIDYFYNFQTLISMSKKQQEEILLDILREIYYTYIDDSIICGGLFEGTYEDLENLKIR